MRANEIKLLYDYNYWANGRILAACAGISETQYTAPVGGSSVRSTLVHTLDAERSWRQGFLNYFVPPEGITQSMPDPVLWEDSELTEADLPTLESLGERWKADESEMRAYIASLRDEDLNGLVRYRVPEGFTRERVLWHCLVHVVNHGTQHRSEAAVLLTNLGRSPGGLDLTAFLNERTALPL